jgi:hypothetical protein
MDEIAVIVLAGGKNINDHGHLLPLETGAGDLAKARPDPPR